MLYVRSRYQAEPFFIDRGFAALDFAVDFGAEADFVGDIFLAVFEVFAQYAEFGSIMPTTLQHSNEY